MESTEELQDFFEEKDIEQEKMKKIALYVENYLNILFRHHDVETTEEEFEEASVNLYRTLLYQSKSVSEELEKEPEDILNNTLSDFEAEDTGKAYGNMMALVGKAGTVEELRHPKITELGVRMAERQEEF